MFRLLLLINSFCWLANALAAHVQVSAARHRGWLRQSRALGDTPITLHIAIKQADAGAAIVQQLLSTSDPASPSFRQHLGPRELGHLSAPSNESLDLVADWLAQHHLPIITLQTPGFYAVNTTITEVEGLLNASYYVYSDVLQREIIRTESYNLPAALADHVDFITPTTVFPRATVETATQIAAKEKDVVGCQMTDYSRRSICGANDQATPTCIRQLYNITHHAQPNRTTFAVYGTEGATFSAKDTTTFLNLYNPPAAAAGAQYTVIGHGAANESSGIGSAFETALDTHTVLGLAWPARGILYNNGGVFGPNPGLVYDPFVQFLHELATNASVPSVVSFSESMPEDMVDATYALCHCNLMAAVGARGTTLFFSSGDNGPNGQQPSGTHNKIFEVEFPASCPWITAVGGTTNLASETAATQSTIGLLDKLSYQASGGGFSNLFATPDYQINHVPAYISSEIPASYFTGAPANGFNVSGRGVPDISAISTNVPATVGGFTFGIAGTSASTPLWAAIVTLLNDYEASLGRPALGFINPWLYNLTASAEQETALKDITSGGNSVGACAFLSGCTLPYTLGYNVTQGWDPVTGLGSPMFSELLAALDRRAASYR